jgi:hypothetical protein
MSADNWSRMAFLVGTLIVANVASSTNAGLQAETVLTDVRAQGARFVVARLYANSDQWNEVMANIGHGGRKWLEVAAALRSGTDAGSSEALDAAMFLALKTAPVAVLRLLKEGSFGTEAVCSSNIGTDYPAEQSRRFVKDRIKVLGSVSRAELLVVRDQCLTGLRAALADLSRSN